MIRSSTPRPYSPVPSSPIVAADDSPRRSRSPNGILTALQKSDVVKNTLQRKVTDTLASRSHKSRGIRLLRPGRSATLTTGRSLPRVLSRTMVPNRKAVRLCGRCAEDPLVARHTRLAVASAACDDGEGSAACFATLIGGTNAQDRKSSVSPCRISSACRTTIVAAGCFHRFAAREQAHRP